MKYVNNTYNSAYKSGYDKGFADGQAHMRRKIGDKLVLSGWFAITLTALINFIVWLFFI